ARCWPSGNSPIRWPKWSWPPRPTAPRGPSDRPAGRSGGEGELAGLGVHVDGIALPELASQDLLRQRVLQLLLDRALQRARPVHGIETGIAQQFEGGIADLD